MINEIVDKYLVSEGADNISIKKMESLHGDIVKYLKQISNIKVNKYSLKVPTLPEGVDGWHYEFEFTIRDIKAGIDIGFNTKNGMSVQVWSDFGTGKKKSVIKHMGEKSSGLQSTFMSVRYLTDGIWQDDKGNEFVKLQKGDEMGAVKIAKGILS